MKRAPLLRFLIGGLVGAFIAATAFSFIACPIWQKALATYICAVLCAIGAIGLYRNQ